jgi:hypothetical protein
LAELIDIAERRNQTTRIAWEQARQAAIDVGIARAALLPVLTASALGGYQRVATPFPSNLVPKGYITANIEEILPTLAIEDHGRSPRTRLHHRHQPGAGRSLALAGPAGPQRTPPRAEEGITAKAGREDAHA